MRNRWVRRQNVNVEVILYRYRKIPRVFYKRNHFTSNLVLDSLKFKKLLELIGKAKKLRKNSKLKSLPGSTQSCTKTM